MALAARAVYTHFKRLSDSKTELPIAINAGDEIATRDVAPPILLNREKNEFIGCKPYDEKNKAIDLSIRKSSLSSQSSTSSDSSDESEILKAPVFRIQDPIAILPQYVTQAPVTIIVSEANLPRLGSSFEVFTPASDGPLFTIQRERPSLHHRQTIVDATSSKPVLTVRRLTAQFPQSYAFEDPCGTKVLEIQGNFFVPYRGAKSTTVFTNAIDGSKTTLAMKGSWRNRHAAIKNEVTGEMLARMTSDLLNTKNLVGGRRTYEIEIAGGVDAVLIVAMIMALDARAS